MEEKSCCYIHPEQVVIGVCKLCLNEKLLLVAAKQGHHHRLQSFMHNRKPSSVSIHKIFAFGNSLFSRQESQQLKSGNYDDDDASPSPEESFISIKFEENGVASWEKNTVVSNNKVPLENSQILNKDTKSNVKSNNVFRWRKRIGHLFHVIQWRRSIKSGVCHVGSKLEGVKVRKSWMRTLTKRKTME